MAGVMDFILCGSTNLRDLDFANISLIKTCSFLNSYNKFFCRVISWHSNSGRLAKRSQVYSSVFKQYQASRVLGFHYSEAGMTDPKLK